MELDSPRACFVAFFQETHSSQGGRSRQWITVTLSLVWSLYQGPGQLKLHSETLSKQRRGRGEEKKYSHSF